MQWRGGQPTKTDCICIAYRITKNIFLLVLMIVLVNPPNPLAISYGFPLIIIHPLVSIYRPTPPLLRRGKASY